jgi:hypothetical protein
MKAFLLFVLALVFGLTSVQSAEAVLFPRLAIRRQPVVVQPLVVRQRFVAPVQVQHFVAPQLQFRSFQSFSTPGCGAFLVR